MIYQRSGACSITSNCSGKENLILQLKQLQNLTEYNKLCSNNQNAQIRPTSSVHDALFKMST